MQRLNPLGHSPQIAQVFFCSIDAESGWTTTEPHPNKFEVHLVCFHNNYSEFAQSPQIKIFFQTCSSKQFSFYEHDMSQQYQTFKNLNFFSCGQN